MRSGAALAAALALGGASVVAALAPQPDYDRVLGTLDGTLPKPVRPSPVTVGIQNAVKGISDFQKQTKAGGTRVRRASVPSKPSISLPSLPSPPSLPSLDLEVLDVVPGGAPGAAVGLTSLALVTRSSLVRSKKKREEAERKREEAEKKARQFSLDFDRELPVYDVPSILRSSAVSAASDVGTRVGKTKAAADLASRTRDAKERADRLSKDLQKRASVINKSQVDLLQGKKVDLPKIDLKALKAPKVGTLPKPGSAAFKPKPAVKKVNLKAQPAAPKPKPKPTVTKKGNVDVNTIVKPKPIIRMKTTSDLGPAAPAAATLLAGLATFAARRDSGVSSGGGVVSVKESAPVVKPKPKPAPPPAPPKPAPVAPVEVAPKKAAPVAPAKVAPATTVAKVEPKKAEPPKVEPKKAAPVVPKAPAPAAIAPAEGKAVAPSLLEVAKSNENASKAVGASALVLLAIGLRNSGDERQAIEDSREGVTATEVVAAAPVEAAAVEAEAPPAVAPPTVAPPAAAPPVEPAPVKAPKAAAPPAAPLGDLARDIQGQIDEIDALLGSFTDAEVRGNLEGQKRDLEEMLEFALQNDL